MSDEADTHRLMVLLPSRRWSIGTKGMPAKSLAEVTGIDEDRIVALLTAASGVSTVAPDRPRYFVLDDAPGPRLAPS